MKLQDSKAAIAIVDAQECDPLQAEFCVDVARQRVSLHAIVLNIGVSTRG